LAVVRELTTVLDFKSDMSGLQTYEKGVERIKGLVLEAGKMFGLYFAIDKIGEYVKEVVNAGKEMMRLNIQIAQVARSTDDVQVITDTLFNTAQKLGVEYNEIASTFREFLNDSHDSKVSQEELLTATENVYKSLRVGRASAEEMHEALNAMQRGMRLGRFGPRQIGVLLDIPGISRELVQASGLSREAIMELGKTGKVTGETIISWLVKPNQQLNAEFDKMPVKISVVFVRIKNQLAAAAAELWKASQGFAGLGRIIWFVFSTASTWIKNLITLMGGLKQAIELVSIAIGVVLGPLLVRQIYLTARLAIVSWTAWLPWIAIAAAVAAVAVAIQDLWYWFQGKPSLIGTWAGPFEDMKKAFMDNPLVKAFTGLNESLDSTQKIILAITAGFVAWNAISFAKLLWNLAKVAAASLVAKDAAEIGGPGGLGGKGKTGGTPGSESGKPGAVEPGAKPGGGRGLLFWLGMIPRLAGLIFAGPAGQVTGEADPQDKQIEDAERKRREWDASHPGQTPSVTGGLWDSILNFFKQGAMIPRDEQGNPINAPAPGAQTMPWDKPGASGPTNNNVNTQLTQNNTINVTGDTDGNTLAGKIMDGLSRVGNQFLGSVSREIQNAIPRSEKATQ
jgi:hypothetical protein